MMSKDEQDKMEKILKGMIQTIGNILYWDYLKDDDIATSIRCLNYRMEDCMEIINKTKEGE